MKLEFLCGCTTGEVISRANLTTMDAIYIDPEGMLTCAIHHMRRKGWRSVPASSSRPGLKHGAYLGATPAQIEGRIVFGEFIPVRGSLKIQTTTVLDLRDNRDPRVIGNKILSRFGANAQKMTATGYYDEFLG